MRPFKADSPDSIVRPQEQVRELREWMMGVHQWIRQADAGFGKLTQGKAPIGTGPPISGSSNHHTLTHLTDFDDHPQYLYLAGRTPGQVLECLTTQEPALTVKNTAAVSQPRYLQVTVPNTPGGSTAIVFRVQTVDGTKNTFAVFENGQLTISNPLTYSSPLATAVPLSITSNLAGTADAGPAIEVRTNSNGSGGTLNFTVGQSGRIISWSPNLSDSPALPMALGTGASLGQYYSSPSSLGWIMRAGSHGNFALDFTQLPNNALTSLPYKWRPGPYDLFFPATQGAASTTLVNDGSGNLTWNTLLSILAVHDHSDASHGGNSLAPALIVVTNTAAGTIPMVVKGHAAQSNALQEWQTSAAVMLARIDAVGAIYTKAKVYFVDGGGTGTLDHEAYTTDQFHYLPNLSGTILLRGGGSDPAAAGEIGRVNRAGGSAATSNLGSSGSPILLTNASAAGFYQIFAVLECAANGAGSPTLRLKWTDVAAQTTPIATLSMTITGNVTTAMVPIYLSSGNISWYVDGYSSGTYNVRIRVVYIGA